TCWTTCTLAHTYMSVDNRWKSSGKHFGGVKKKHGVVFIWSPRRRTRSVSACRYGPVLQILQNGLGQGHFSLVHTGLNSLIFAARVSSDSPRLKAFCRVAPSVLFKVRAIVPACVLLFASFFKVRTSFAVQVRLRLFILWSPRYPRKTLYLLLLKKLISIKLSF